MANGAGFVAGEGDLVGLVIDPTEINNPNTIQPLIIATEFESLKLDCECSMIA